MYGATETCEEAERIGCEAKVPSSKVPVLGRIASVNVVWCAIRVSRFSQVLTSHASEIAALRIAEEALLWTTRCADTIDFRGLRQTIALYELMPGLSFSAIMLASKTLPDPSICR